MELKPCPKCGKDPLVYKYLGIFIVCCTNCDGRYTIFNPDKEETIRAWNNQKQKGWI